MNKKTFDVEMDDWWDLLIKSDAFRSLISEARWEFGILPEGIENPAKHQKWRIRQLNATIHNPKLFKKLSDFYVELETFAVSLIKYPPSDSRSFRRALIYYFETGRIDRRFLSADVFITTSIDIFLDQLSYLESFGQFDADTERVFIEVGPNVSNTAIRKFIGAKKKEIESMQEEIRSKKGIKKVRKSPISPNLTRDSRVMVFTKQTTKELRKITGVYGHTTRGLLIAKAMQKKHGIILTESNVKSIISRMNMG